MLGFVRSSNIFFSNALISIHYFSATVYIQIDFRANVFGCVLFIRRFNYVLIWLCSRCFFTDVF